VRKLIFIAALGLTTAAWAQSPFVGTWKLNPAKGHYTDTTFSYTETTPDHFLFKTGSISYEFNMDGKDYPFMVPNATNSWQPTGHNRWHQIQKLDGKVTGETDTVISDDGKTMTDTHKETAEDETTSQGTVAYQRVGGGPGLEGAWKTENVKFEGDFIQVISEPAAGLMTLESKHDKASQTGPTDGHIPWKLISQHPDADKHFGLTVLRTGPRSLTYSSSLDGKETGKGEMTVSEDGKTLTDTQWDVQAPNEKTTDVYERQ
jgi:hypothetical protein